MINQHSLVYYRARTPLHCGATEAEGGIDLPVVRERSTQFPLIPNTSLKGVWRDYCQTGGVEQWSDDEIWDAFGPDEHADSKKAGNLVFCDAQLLYLPVRCSTGPYLLLTCPMVLRRYYQWLPAGGMSAELKKLCDAIDTDSVFVQQSGPSGKLYLEDLICTAVDKADLEKELPATGVSDWSLPLRALVSNETFTWFCQYGLEISAHNQLKNKISKNLWFEEAVPVESLFYAPLLYARDMKNLADKLKRSVPDFFQVGGLESVGRGLMHVSFATSASSQNNLANTGREQEGEHAAQ